MTLRFNYRHGDDQLLTQKALRTVVAGQQAENLLYVLFFLLSSVRTIDGL